MQALSILLITAQLLVTEKLKDNEEKRDILTGAIDLFIKHKLRATALKFAPSAESLGACGDVMKFTKIITT